MPGPSCLSTLCGRQEAAEPTGATLLPSLPSVGIAVFPGRTPGAGKDRKVPAPTPALGWAALASGLRTEGAQTLQITADSSRKKVRTCPCTCDPSVIELALFCSRSVTSNFPFLKDIRMAPELVKVSRMLTSMTGSCVAS